MNRPVIVVAGSASLGLTWPGLRHGWPGFVGPSSGTVERRVGSGGEEKEKGKENVEGRGRWNKN